MQRRIKNTIRNLIGIKTETDYYSSGGEDAIVSKTFQYFLPTQSGFYVDVGAFHPFKHSNTYVLYKAGWHGVNIDPRPGSKALFDRFRPRDVNIETGISDKDGTMTYHIVRDAPTMNTFSKENLERLGMLDQIEGEISVPVMTFDRIEQSYFPGKRIDYLNIDAEGFEIEILSGVVSCDALPRVISIEQNGILSFNDVLESDAYRLLSDHGFTPFAKNLILRDVATVFYFHKDA
jgi:FkbM family methyltransferase